MAAEKALIEGNAREQYYATENSVVKYGKEYGRNREDKPTTEVQERQYRWIRH